MSTNVTTFHNDLVGTGVNASETTLSPANVKVGSFGKIATTPLDGNVFAQPLVMTGTAVTTGPNTVVAAGTHDVVFVATEHDSLYAIDTKTGVILWKRSFLTSTGTGTTAGTNINNPLNATAITAPTTAQVQCTDISPEYGITGTPVIDAANGIIYVVPFTDEKINGVDHFVQRIHAISIKDGTDVVTPYLIGDTTGTNTNSTPIWVFGTGDGAVTDPYTGSGKKVVQFNALRENQRQALSLVNGKLYISWSSHCDDAPYHGWIADWNVAALKTSGFVLAGVFNSCPNGGEAGIWSGGGRLSFESDNATFYFETGNGSASGNLTLNSSGFPATGNYYEAVVKMTTDTTTSATNQNMNGWGLKVVDYFVPHNQAALDNADQDFGSGAPIILPDSFGIAGHPHLMLAAGKQGVVYVVDRDNMGKFDPKIDHVINAVTQKDGTVSPPVSVTGVLSTPVVFNGSIYYVSGYSGPFEQFQLSSTGTLVKTSQSANGSFGYLPGSPSLSANGTTGGVLWVTDRANNQLHAYDASSLATELWNTSQKAGGVDAPGTIDKLNSPTVANGEVFLGTANSLVIYGLTPPSTKVPNAPVLSAVATTGSSVNLTWTDSTAYPNTAATYAIEELVNGTWTQITTAPGGTTVLSVGGLKAMTSYSFRARGLNGIGYSAYSNTATVTTTNTVPTIDYSSGFAAAGTALKLNGSTKINGGVLTLTDGNISETASAFSTSPVDVTKFSTSFQFQLTSGATTGDGFTFTLQGNGPTALGANGGSLGYAPSITKSVAIKFDLYSNSGEGADSTGIYVNGAWPAGGAVDMTSSGVDLHSGDVFQATLSYDGTKLTETLTDTATGKVFSTSYAINIASYTGSTAYVGFTAGTGANAATQNIQSWTFSPNAAIAPNAPSALGAAVASASSVTLNWTNNASNQTGFVLDRATDAGFTQNLISQTLPAIPNSYTDTYTGLASGGTYYYRIRAINTAGSSANSNVAQVSIPFSPAKPTNFAVDDVTTTSISMSWTDNAGTSATGYNVLRAVNHGAFELYQVLPGLNTATPTEYDFIDAGLTPGTFYDYHVQAFNVAGYNDFDGGSATTITSAPSGVTATAGSSGIVLNWTAPTGAVTYDVYRGTAPGAENWTPIATGITGTTYTDSAVTSGTKYYYIVTAINGNVVTDPGAPNESADSAEVSATAVATAVPAPSNLTATVVSGKNDAMLTWKDNTNYAGSFVFERSTSSTFATIDVTRTSVQGSSYYEDWGLTPGVQYFYRIRSVVGSQVSANSNVATVTVPATAGAPNAPTNFAVSTYNGSTTEAQITWTDNSTNETGFTIQRSTSSTFATIDLTRTAVPNSLYYTDWGLTPGVQYYYRMRADNGSTISAWTSTVAFQTGSGALAAPTGIQITPVSGNNSQLSLSWTDPTGSASYFVLQRSTSSTFSTYTTLANSQYTGPYIDWGLSANTTYYYRIAAVSAAGQSAWSTIASGKTLA